MARPLHGLGAWRRDTVSTLPFTAMSASAEAAEIRDASAGHQHIGGPDLPERDEEDTSAHVAPERAPRLGTLEGGSHPRSGPCRSPEPGHSPARRVHVWARRTRATA